MRKCGHKVETAVGRSSTGFAPKSTSIYGGTTTLTGGMPTQKVHKKPKFFKFAQSIGVLGLAIFLGIVLVGLIGYGRIYFFDGYDFTAVITWISCGTMACGGVFILLSLLAQLIVKNPFIRPKNIVVSVVVLIACAALVIFIGNKYEEEESKNNNNYYGYTGGTYGDSNYDDDLVSKTLGLSITVNSITKSPSGSYTYVKCTITNVSSRYGTPTKYRYIKAKGVFKNSSGSIIDTDWTYAIDSVWLEPGESKQFEFMVASSSVKYATVTVMED